MRKVIFFVCLLSTFGFAQTSQLNSSSPSCPAGQNNVQWLTDKSDPLNVKVSGCVQSPAGAQAAANAAQAAANAAQAAANAALQSNGCLTTAGGNLSCSNVTASSAVNSPNVNGVISAGSYLALAIAVSICPNPGTIQISAPINIPASLTVPATCALEIKKGGMLNISSGQTVTINGGLTAPEDAQIFQGSGSVAGLSLSRPEWFGSTATVCKAIDALSTNGGLIPLRVAAYRSGCEKVSPTDFSILNFMTKPNVHILGSLRPVYNSGYTQLVNGTVIQGGFLVRANGFRIEHVGVDTGSVVWDLLGYTEAGYTATDSLAITGALPYDSTHYPYLTGTIVNDVNCLGVSTTSPDHCMLVENVTGARVTNVQTMYHTHGLVLKGVNSVIDGVYATGSAADAVIVKSDTYSPTSNNYLSNISAFALSTAGDTGGITLEGATAALGDVFLNGVKADQTSFGILLQSDKGLTGVSITNFTYNGEFPWRTYPALTTSGAGMIATVSLTNFAISNSGGINTPSPVQYFSATNGYMGAITGDGFLLQADSLISNVGFNTVSGHAINQVAGTARVNNLYGTTTGSFFAGTVSYSDSWTVQPITFINGWHNYGGGNSIAGYSIDRGTVRLLGLIVPGTAMNVTSTLPTGYRPAAVSRFSAIGYSGGTAYEICEVIVDTTGFIGITNYATCATSYVSLDGITFKAQ